MVLYDSSAQQATIYLNACNVTDNVCCPSFSNPISEGYTYRPNNVLSNASLFHISTINLVKCGSPSGGEILPGLTPPAVI